MTHRLITEGPGVPPAAGAYSPGVVAGETLYVSGQIALDAEGTLRSGTPAEEAELAMGNVLAVLTAAGFAPTDLVLVQILLADVAAFAAVDGAYAALLPAGHRPARMTFQAGALPLGAQVEIQAVAVRRG